MVSELEVLEVFRLGVAGGVEDVVRVVGDHLAARFAVTSRFPEVLTLTDRSLAVQVSAGTLVWRGRARQATGDLGGALGDYEGNVSNENKW